MAAYTDLFTRADGAVVGTPWVETESPNGNAFQILSNALYQRTRAWRGFIYYNDVVGADQSSKLTFESIAGSPFGGPAVRIDPAGAANNFTGYVARYSGAVISLRKYVAETLDDTTTGTELGTYTVTLGAGDAIEIRAVGTTISVLVNDVTQISVTDNAIADGEMGVASIGAGGIGNDFTWSAWAGGDVVLPPTAPSGLVASVPTVEGADLDWTDNATTETEYQIMYRVASGAWPGSPQITGLAADSIAYTLTGLTEGTAYEARVRCVNAGGNSDWSNVVSFTTLPTAPSGVAASPAPGSANLTWNDNSGGETSQQIRYRVTGGSYPGSPQVTGLAADLEAYTLTGLDPATSYDVQVRAVNAAGNSAWSTEITFSTLGIVSSGAHLGVAVTLGI